MKRCLLFVVLMVTVAACAKPSVYGRTSGPDEYFSREYTATPNDVYYAVRNALMECQYPLGEENLREGFITSTWVPVKSDSHHVMVFRRPDYSVTNSYYQLDIQIVPSGGVTEVKVGSKIKSLVSNLKSSGVEEVKLLDHVGNALRKSEPTISNLGVDE